MKYSTIDLERIYDVAKSICSRLEDEINVQYRLDRITSESGWGSPGGEINLPAEYAKVLELLHLMGPMPQITVSNRFKERRARELGIVDGAKRVCSLHDFWRADSEVERDCPHCNRIWEDDQTDLISLLTEAGIDGWTEADEVAAAHKPTLNGDNEPGY